MEKNSTLNALTAFTANEKPNTGEPGMISDNSSKPSQSVINNILNYSKALSIHKTKKRGSLEFLLN